MLLLALAGPAPAPADDGCVTTPTGIDCTATGTSTTEVVGPTHPGKPFRYLRVTRHPTIGDCWYWATRPPGLDSWDPANDQAIIMTRWALPACPGPGSAEVGEATVLERAWQVFRSFPLEPPIVTLSPADRGITGIETILVAGVPPPLRHREVLPDGTVLVVTARVTRLVVEWGDGSPGFSLLPETVAGGIGHSWLLKTCSPGYRASHPAGHRCHPDLEAYPITVTARWSGRYWLRGTRTGLGVLTRATTVTYDVDEVIGVPTP